MNHVVQFWESTVPQNIIYIYIYCNIAKAWVHPGSPVDVSVPNQGIYMTSGRKVGAITMEGESYQLISGPPWIHTDHYLK